MFHILVVKAKRILNIFLTNIPKKEMSDELKSCQNAPIAKLFPAHFWGTRNRISGAIVRYDAESNFHKLCN